LDFSLQEFNVWDEGDGDQQLKFYLNDFSWTVQDLLSDPNLKGYQKFEFKEQKDKRGVRVFGEAWSSLKFQEAAAAIGPGKVPLSLVIYIDGTFVQHGIDVRPVYSE
jgi:hypothetical protein